MEEKISVVARDWRTRSPKVILINEGDTLEKIIEDALTSMRREGAIDKKYLAHLKKHAVARIDLVTFKPADWKKVKPKSGSRIEILVKPAGGGGGGGKSGLGTLLGIVVAVAAIAVSIYFPPAIGLAAGTALSSFVGGVAGLAVMGLGMLAVNALCPPATPSLGISSRSDSTKDSPTYSITGAANGMNPYGYVPLILGRHRVFPPLGGKSWTSVEGDKQYFNMMVIWGHADINVYDVKIGDSPLGDFRNVEFYHHPSTTGEDLKLFSKSYNETSVDADLTNAAGWVTRTVGKANDLSIDIMFPSGLTHLDNKTGDKQWREIGFQIQYREVGSSTWLGFRNPVNVGSSATFTNIPYQYEVKEAYSYETCWNIPNTDNYDCGYRRGYNITYHNYTNYFSVDAWGNITHSVNGWNGYALYTVTGNSVADHRASWMSGFGYSYDPATRTMTISTGSVQDENFSISGATTKQIIRNFRVNNLPLAEYEVRIRRTTGDSSSNYDIDKSTWVTMRAITNKPAFNSPVPLCCSELRILASEQLSGSINNLNGMCVSVIPDWNGSSWVVRETSNPASHFRYVLTNTLRHGLSNPYTLSKLDEESLIAFHNHCTSEGWTFDYVCDSEEVLWERLTQICSVARGGVTMGREGKWGILIDKPGKEPVQLFTPRNSWGFSVTRNFPKVPHALRVKYVDNADNYEQRESYVYADGYNYNTATDIQEWSFPGATNWENNWRQGRYHLATMLLRPITITINTDWEWCACQRGDVVGVSHDVLMNTFGAARITALIDTNNNTITDPDVIPTAIRGVEIDDVLVFSEPSPARYGMAVRLQDGKLSTYELNPMYDQETNRLIFRYETTSGVPIPKIGDLATFSLISNEYGRYLVTAISPSNDTVAELTLIPEAEGVFQADKGEIPPYIVTPILDQLKKLDKTPVPIIKSIVTDESVLVWNAGSLVPQIAIYFTYKPDSLMNVSVEAVAIKNGEDTVASRATVQREEGIVNLGNVEEEASYTVKIRAISDAGIPSDWVTRENVKVVGKTSLPPDVENVTASIESPLGIRVSWDAVEVIDLNNYEIRGDARLDTTDTTAIVQVKNKVGTIKLNVSAVDTGGRKSENATEATVTVNPPKAVFYSSSYDDVVTKSDGAYIEWASCETTWPIRDYAIKDEYTGKTINCLTETLRVEPRPSGSYTFRGTARDIFDNKGDTGSYLIQINPPAAPEPVISVHNMSLRVSWSAVDTDFPIDRYEVYDGYGALKYSLKATFFDVNDPIDGTTYNIYAVDTAGNRSTAGVLEVDVEPPSAPSVNVAVNEVRKDGAIIRDTIKLSWTAPSSTLPVIGYEVWRQYEDESGNVKEEDYGMTDATFMVLPPVKVGEHTYFVRAINSAGTKGATGYEDFLVKASGAPTMKNPSVIDNNVLLYWNAPTDVFFTVNAYEVYSESKLVGVISGLFATVFETVSGLYTYKVVPVDIAGNKGTPASIRARVNQPPDYVFFAEYDAHKEGFTGTRSNLQVVDSYMFGPMSNWPETWTENSTRCATAGMATTYDVLTWKNKVDKKAPLFFSPQSGTATYVKVIDYGTLLTSVGVKINVVTTQIEGTSTIAIKIEGSQDGGVWVTFAENDDYSLLNNVRYVRYTITIKGGLVRIDNILARLNSKKLMDTGRVYTDKDDNGPNVATDPMDTGTYVPFNKTFVDVIQPITVEAADGSTDVHPLVVFVDVVNPKGFRVSLFDNTGTRISGHVKWTCSGY